MKKNVAAKALSLKQYCNKVVKSKKIYNRKKNEKVTSSKMASRAVFELVTGAS